MTSNHPVLKRFEAAKSRRDRWTGVLRDAFEYCLPQTEAFNDHSEGTRRGDRVFDGTAPDAIQEAAFRLVGTLVPEFKNWFDLKPGRDVLERANGDDKALTEIQRTLDKSRDSLHAHIEASNAMLELIPAIKHALVSTGALALHEGDDHQPLRFEAIPLSQLYPEEGPHGRIDTCFRHWELPVRNILRTWPDAILPDTIKSKTEKEPDTKIPIVEAMMFDREKGDYEYRVVAREAGVDMVERRYKTSPFLIFRLDKAPGELLGRGPALNVLGDIKTANKIVELTLRNASIAVSGIWQADDDGVLNPATVRLAPGTIIPRAQGSRGLQPLETPGRFDVGQLVLQQLQERIRRALLGPSLPSEDGPVRSPTEMAIRERDVAIQRTPMYLRLFSELVIPMAKRAADILERKGIMGPLEIDGRSARAVPASPAMRATIQAEAQQAVQTYQQIAELDPIESQAAIDSQRLIDLLIDGSGMPAHIRRTGEQREAKRQELMEAAQQAMVAQAQAEQQQQGGDMQ